MGLAETIEAVELIEDTTDVAGQEELKLRGNTIEDTRDQIRRSHERAAVHEIEYAENLFEAVGKLRAAGFELNPWNTGCYYWKVTVADLPKIRRTLGKLSLYNKCAITHDEAYEGPQMVEVTLSVEGYPSIKVEYDTVFKDTGKCKIVETVSTSKYRSLVCSR